ncbi:glycoside hydrolase family 10 protein [Autumnicola musiva]|uniref:Family 10 glycosylhydrolase n=1 Tax=Autumnicola musiva TaxID=3075589 RepID=A0ABU3D1I5_9FLAO|nr:family 10 glycosylhydrolase [Zunongwangia sp. F117]MDT0675400.1 family 10 glycosylhydrolase [Zunongwangia sp. F117]
MTGKRSYYLLFLICFLSLNSCKTTQSTAPVKQPPEVEKSNEVSPTEDKPSSEIPSIEKEEIQPVPVAKKEKVNFPQADREFRAAWVATVANINWPSRPGLNSKEQQREAIGLLDFLKNHHFNAVILQVRPQADALYQSDLEPWSYFLTGKQGQAPEPFYDPLHFWIEAAHDRGLELHAWLNPYRAHHTTGKEISEQSVIKTNPELVVKLENGMWWMDPSKEGTKKRTTNVVMDLIKRYDLDGIHFDDYFYPYASYNNGKDFPDDETWNIYLKQSGKLSRADWRREHVNSFVENLYNKIKAEKPRVKFGLSPFGIWRPGYPESIAGMDQYNELYADARLWLNKGWIDYYSPQLYWRINKLPQSFPVLLGWWSAENTRNRHLWPGINVGLSAEDNNPHETISQIMITRGMLPESPGVLHWSIAPLIKNPSLATGILEGPYQKEALVPTTPWLDNEPPKSPVSVSEIVGEKLKITWVPANPENIFRYVLYYRYNDNWNYKILNRKDNILELPAFIRNKNSEKINIKAVAVTAVDRMGNESDFQEVLIKNAAFK